MGNGHDALKINAAGGNMGVGIAQLLVPFMISLGSLGAVFGGGSQPRTDSATSATGEVFVQKAAFFGYCPLCSQLSASTSL